MIRNDRVADQNVTIKSSLTSGVTVASSSLKDVMKGVSIVIVLFKK